MNKKQLAITSNRVMITNALGALSRVVPGEDVGVDEQDLCLIIGKLHRMTGVLIRMEREYAATIK